MKEHEDKYITMKDGGILPDKLLLKKTFDAEYLENSQLINNCEKYAGWTLPNEFPEVDFIGYQETQYDYQSLGARLTTNLTNKIMMALFQPTAPFFKMEVTEAQVERIIKDEPIFAEPSKRKAAMANAEREAMKYLNKKSSRTVLTDVISQLIITGNALLHIPEGTDNLQMYTLRDYIINRDTKGNVNLIIIKETKKVAGLKDYQRNMALEEGKRLTDKVSLYTGIQRRGDQFIVWQEMEDICFCHTTYGVFDEDDLPYIALTWKRATNKDYGTGLVENYAGDFHTLSCQHEAKLDYIANATDIKYLVSPSGMTDIDTLTNAPSGSYLIGREEDIYTHQSEVSGALQQIIADIEATSRNLSQAFLMFQPRQGERVTAFETRETIQELEGSLGGVYSRLANDLQLPLARHSMTDLSPIFKGIEPTIVTGLETLSRGADLSNIRAYIQDLAMLTDVPPEVKERLNMEALMAELGAGHNVKYQDWTLDEDTVQENRKAMMEDQANLVGQEEQAKADAQSVE